MVVQSIQAELLQCCRDQPHINLVFAAELSYVQLLDSGCAAVECIALSTSPVYSAWKMSGRLNVLQCLDWWCAAMQWLQLCSLQTKQSVCSDCLCLGHLSDTAVSYTAALPAAKSNQAAIGETWTRCFFSCLVAAVGKIAWIFRQLVAIFS